MFPKLTIESKNKFSDLGLFAESLIFYQNSNFIFDPGSFPQALKKIGYENFTELCKSGQFEAKVNCHGLGGGNVKANLYTISAVLSPSHTLKSTIEKAVKSLFGESSESNDKITELLKLVNLHEYSDKFIAILNSEISNCENLIDAITLLTNNEFNQSNINLDIEQIDEGFYNIESNVPNKVINDACFLICVGSGKIFNSELYSSELVTNDKIQSYPNRRIDRIVNKRNGTEKQLSHFHEFVLPNYYDISSTMNSGSQSIDGFMDLWRSSMQFKNWLKDEEPNVELITAYLNEIGKKNFLHKLPMKAIRWLLFTGIGVAVAGEIGGRLGTGVSVGVDLFNDLVLDGVNKKQFWKPNHFVKGEYHDFLTLGI